MESKMNEAVKKVAEGLRQASLPIINGSCDSSIEDLRDLLPLIKMLQVKIGGEWKTPAEQRAANRAANPASPASPVVIAATAPVREKRPDAYRRLLGTRDYKRKMITFVYRWCSLYGPVTKIPPAKLVSMANDVKLHQPDGQPLNASELGWLLTVASDASFVARGFKINKCAGTSSCNARYHLETIRN